jgi:uncharacterized protein (TIGR03000 family)
MKKLLFGFVLTLGAMIWPTGTANALDGDVCAPWASSAAFPTMNPPGWYTNTYWYSWYNPWYAYYNYSQGPYANWTVGRGYATYGNLKQMAAIGLTAQVVIHLPAEANLLFSGNIATGTGGIRTFTTPPLEANQEYAYEMTVELVKDGKTLKLTKVVAVHAGENVEVKFDLAELKEIVPEKK